MTSSNVPIVALSKATNDEKAAAESGTTGTAGTTEESKKKTEGKGESEEAMAVEDSDDYWTLYGYLPSLHKMIFSPFSFLYELAFGASTEKEKEKQS